MEEINSLKVCEEQDDKPVKLTCVICTLLQLLLMNDIVDFLSKETK